ncbi:hypothetical protein AAVH_22283 [Aphelenchoides avenae]|nr:hypothetical protein AAVH_22283 [Aphelenchus avenae]
MKRSEAATDEYHSADEGDPALSLTIASTPNSSTDVPESVSFIQTICRWVVAVAITPSPTPTGHIGESASLKTN